MATLSVGAPVKIRMEKPVPALLPFVGEEGVVTSLDQRSGIIDVAFGEDRSVTSHVAYFDRVRGARAKSTRRSTLRLTAPTDDRKEAPRQAEGVLWLRQQGYRVIETDTHRGVAKCNTHRNVVCRCPVPDCGKPGFTLSTGADAGLADTEVQHPRWPGVPVVSMQVEWKQAANGERRPAQAERESRGEIVVAWDLPSLARAIVAFERSIGVESLPVVAAVAKAAEAGAA